MRCAVALACLVLACGDNRTSPGLPLGPASELVIVARPADELLRMNPDVIEAVRRHDSLTAVYLTENTVSDRDTTYAALKAAYGSITGLHSWTCGSLAIGEYLAFHCRHGTRDLSLVFLDLAVGTLPTAWNDANARDALLATLTEILRISESQTIRTNSVTSVAGSEVADDLVTGALATLALARANSHAELVAYRGDSADTTQANVLPAIFEAAREVFAYVTSCTAGCGECGTSCGDITTSDAERLQRRYAISMRRRVGGRLRNANQCISDNLDLVSCSAAQVWTLDSAGELRSRNQCMTVDAQGVLTMTTCVGGLERRFLVDDEGHIFAGMPPTFSSGNNDGFLWCVAPSTGTVQLQRCTMDNAPRWELQPDTIITQRSTLALTGTGRDVRLADITGDRKADLCAIASGLYCAVGDGAGSFAVATRIDSTAAPLAIEPRSLVLADIDGDKKTDACGRDAQGILCARAATTFAAERWTSHFDDSTKTSQTAASLAILDANADGAADICGVTSAGVSCWRKQDDTMHVLSSWPAADTVVWLADLDGDDKADWCTPTGDGAACAVAAQSEQTTDGALWGYVQRGMFEVTPATTATVAVADIDADGRADLCSLRDDRIVCARSQGRAFGPRSTLAVLPNQATASALWLGDLDGDGRADPCVDAGTTIVCAVQP